LRPSLVIARHCGGLDVAEGVFDRWPCECLLVLDADCGLPKLQGGQAGLAMSKF